MSERNSKIDKINAYRKVIETKRLPKVDDKADVTVESQIISEFSTWAEGQLAVLLGEQPHTSHSPDFSEDEVTVLKHVAAKILTKVSAREISQVPTEQTPQPKPVAASIRKDVPAKPLPKAPAAKRPANVNSLIAALEKMENEGPEF
jgi:hypothetical protein